MGTHTRPFIQRCIEDISPFVWVCGSVWSIGCSTVRSQAHAHAHIDHYVAPHTRPCRYRCRYRCRCRCRYLYPRHHRRVKEEKRRWTTSTLCLSATRSYSLVTPYTCPLPPRRHSLYSYCPLHTLGVSPTYHHPITISKDVGRSNGRFLS